MLHLPAGGISIMNAPIGKLALAIILTTIASSADAAVWGWGCRGKLGTEEVVFNRNTLAVVSGKAPKQTLRSLVQRDEPVDDKVEAVRFNTDDNNGGFEKAMRFSK